MLQTIDIINEMLAATGAAPLTSNDTSHPYYVKAKNKLDIVNTEVQSTGWWFNTSCRTIPQDENGEILLPNNVFQADPVDTTKNYILRQGKLYDADERTYEIGEPVETVYVERVNIESLPLTVGQLIRTTAVYQFYRDEDGNQPKLGEYYRAMERAEVLLKREHLKNADVNFFYGTSAMQMQRGYRLNRLPPLAR